MPRILWQAPIHCIGMQAYLLPNQLSMELMAYRLDKLATLGLKLYVTEFLFPTAWTGDGGVNNMTQVSVALAVGA